MSKLIIIFILVVAGFSLSPQPPSNKVFLQIWIDKTELDRVKKECLSAREVTLDYSDGYYAILPCPMVNK